MSLHQENRKTPHNDRHAAIELSEEDLARVVGTGGAPPELGQGAPGYGYNGPGYPADPGGFRGPGPGGGPGGFGDPPGAGGPAGFGGPGGSSPLLGMLPILGIL